MIMSIYATQMIRRRYNVDGSYLLQNPLKMSFGKVSYRYTYGQRNILFSSRIAPDEVEIAAQNIENRFNSHKVVFTVSRFTRFLKGTTTINLNMQWDRAETMINDERLMATPFSWGADASIAGKLSQTLSWTYTPNYSFHAHTYVGGSGNARQYEQIAHQVRLNYKFSSGFYLEADGRINSLLQQNGSFETVFVNSKLIYLLNKRWLERVSLTGFNLLNEDKDILFYHGHNLTFARENQLRGRMFLINAVFTIHSL